VTGKVLTLAPALAPVVPAFLALLDVPVEEAAWQALDPLQRRQRTLDAVKRLLLRESEVQPLVVVFEELHWIDGETQTLLDSLVESLPATRLLLLVNYRPEYSHAWGGKTYYRQLRIDPLPPESADELLAALLGADAALGPLKQLLVERTEANPLFLEECAPSSRTCRPRSSSTRPGSFPTSSTRSSMRSLTRWRTRGCSTTGSAPCTPASLRPSSGSRPSASRSRPSGWPTTPCAGSCGRRPLCIFARRGSGP